jgi:monoamine oxidase
MSESVTRRGLLGGAAGVAAAASLPGDAEAAKKRSHRKSRSARPRRADVVVVGAGLAGLAAAERVAAAGKSVVVLEARDRVGGRTLNRDIGGGEVVEIGGQWIGPTQDVIAAWAKELGVETFKTYNEGSYVYHRGGRRTPYTANTPVLGAHPAGPWRRRGGRRARADQRDGQEVPVEAPWTATRAEEWDSQTAYTWIRENTASDGGRFLTDLGVSLVYAAEARDVSFLQVLFNVAAAGNETTPGTFERLINTAGGAQESRFVGGSQRISFEAARRLGRRVVLRSPVRRIVQTPTHVRVESDHTTVIARQCIVTGPPAVTARIDFQPLLPDAARAAAPAHAAGLGDQVPRDLRPPFWRDEGLAGQAVGDRGPCRVTFDNSPPDGSPGVLLGFVEGTFARSFSALSEARGATPCCRTSSTSTASRHGDPRAYFETNWGEEEWTRGMLRRLLPARRPARLRARDARAVRPRPLGRSRHRDDLERVHGRGRPLRPPRGGRGPRRVGRAAQRRLTAAWYSEPKRAPTRGSRIIRCCQPRWAAAHVPGGTPRRCA